MSADLVLRLRDGIDPHDGIREAESVMDAAADEIVRLRAALKEIMDLPEVSLDESGAIARRALQER